MRRQTIALIWAGGLLLALALYITGPDRFFETCLAFIDRIDEVFRGFVYQLGVRALHVVRALSIAIYAVFVVLALMAARRGLRAWGALVVISAVFFMLVWRPYAMETLPPGRWMSALLVVLAGAAVMTHRLMSPPPSGPGWRRTEWNRDPDTGGSNWSPPAPPPGRS